MIGLGTRWRFGSPPPARLPEAAAAAVRRAEDELREAPEAASASWTLTWLEGRPVAELDHETAQGWPTVTVDPVTGEGTLSYER